MNNLTKLLVERVEIWRRCKGCSVERSCKISSKLAVVFLRYGCLKLKIPSADAVDDQLGESDVREAEIFPRVKRLT